MEENVLREQFVTEVNELRNSLDIHHQHLEQQAIWLFVATLACWSVKQVVFNVVAFIIVAFIFYKLVFRNKKPKVIDKVIKELMERIMASSMTEDQKKARKLELQEMSNECLSNKAMFRRVPQFVIGYAFWVASLIYHLVEIL